VRSAAVPVRIEWGSRSTTLRRGEDPAVVRGLPSELAMALQARQRAAEMEYAGPPQAVARLRDAHLGV
jgi:hypothetical protein